MAWLDFERGVKARSGHGSPSWYYRRERRSRCERSPATLGRGKRPREKQAKTGPAKKIDKMKKTNLIVLITIAAVLPFFIFKGGVPTVADLKIAESQQQLLEYLRVRDDVQAGRLAQEILAIEPDNLTALWAKAELLRRVYDLENSRAQLVGILKKYPAHVPSTISLAYIYYYNRDFNQAFALLKKVINDRQAQGQNLAMAYMLIGSINAKKSSAGGIFSKFTYGTRVKGYFEKAKKISPDLPEVYLGLGTFYLLAPAIAGGNPDKAIENLKYAVKLAPQFATANARLAQAYQRKGDAGKYNYYFERAKELDPGNEVLREIE